MLYPVTLLLSDETVWRKMSVRGKQIPLQVATLISHATKMSDSFRFLVFKDISAIAIPTGVEIWIAIA